MTQAIFVFFILLQAIFAHQASAEVWVSENTWNQDWERKYEKWVGAHILEDMFTNPQSLYFGIPTDCSDAVYTARILFAAENNLPFGIVDKTSKYDNEPGVRKITNEMGRWNSTKPLPWPYEARLKEVLKSSEGDDPQLELLIAAQAHWKTLTESEKRLRFFIKYVSEMTSTWTWPDDALAVSLDVEGIRPGGIALKRRSHTYIIKEIDVYGNIVKMSSDLPHLIRPLKVRMSQEMQPKFPNEGGYMTFRYVDELGVPFWKLQRYRSEQYLIYKKIEKEVDAFVAEKGGEYESNGVISYNLKNYRFNQRIKVGDGVRPGLAKEIESPNHVVERLYNHLCSYAQDRIPVVLRGIQYKESVNRCLTKAEYNDHSTPSRDQNLMNYFFSLRQQLEVFRENGTLDDFEDKSWVEHLLALVKDPAANLLWDEKSEENYFQQISKIPFSFSEEDNYGKFCTLPFDPQSGKILDLRQVVWKNYHGFLESDPNATLQARWGLTEYLAEECPHYE